VTILEEINKFGLVFNAEISHVCSNAEEFFVNCFVNSPKKTVMESCVFVYVLCSFLFFVACAGDSCVSCLICGRTTYARPQYYVLGMERHGTHMYVLCVLCVLYALCSILLCVLCALCVSCVL
jgi:hypothetical protein